MHVDVTDLEVKEEEEEEEEEDLGIDDFGTDDNLEVEFTVTPSIPLSGYTSINYGKPEE